MCMLMDRLITVGMAYEQDTFEGTFLFYPVPSLLPTCWSRMSRIGERRKRQEAAQHLAQQKNEALKINGETIGAVFYVSKTT